MANHRKSCRESRESRKVEKSRESCIKRLIGFGGIKKGIVICKRI
jgi:hypothetical protein